ncbi:unnamed protein product [Arctogadus glacialis]
MRTCHHRAGQPWANMAAAPTGANMAAPWTGPNMAAAPTGANMAAALTGTVPKTNPFKPVDLFTPVIHPGGVLVFLTPFSVL